jgi:5'-nucleotidase
MRRPPRPSRASAPRSASSATAWSLPPTAVFENTGCTRGECTAGSLIAEAMLAAVPGADLAIQNGGGTRASFPAGTVTYGDVLTVLPFGQHAGDRDAARRRPACGAGERPIPAGLRPLPAGRLGCGSRRASRARSASAWSRPRSCAASAPGPLDPERAYRIVTNNFLRRGGDGYAALRDGALEAYDTGPLLEEVVAAHLAAQSPAAPRLDGRITLR